jgi:hypothetical protein
MNSKDMTIMTEKGGDVKRSLRNKNCIVDERDRAR